MSEFSHTVGASDADESQSSFWSDWETRYKLRYASPAAYPAAAVDYWLTDDMHYHVEELKSQGEYASVWKAKECTSGRLLVVKRFEAAQTPNFQARVKAEASILDKVRVGVSTLRLLLATSFANVKLSLTSCKLEPHAVINRTLRKGSNWW
jgi:hypothetical protein